MPEHPPENPVEDVDTKVRIGPGNKVPARAPEIEDVDTEVRIGTPSTVRFEPRRKARGREQA